MKISFETANLDARIVFERTAVVDAVKVSLQINGQTFGVQYVTGETLEQVGTGRFSNFTLHLEEPRDDGPTP
jgi:hypothetical protein